MRDFVNVWDEFISLGWSKKEFIRRDIKDLEIYPKIFLREEGGSWKIYYLPIATILTIPAPWPSMWTEFNVWAGELISYVTGIKGIVTGINKFGKLMTLWTSHINSDMCGTSKEYMFETILPELIETGTSEFREMMREQYKIELSPWKILTPREEQEI